MELATMKMCLTSVASPISGLGQRLQSTNSTAIPIALAPGISHCLVLM